MKQSLRQEEENWTASTNGLQPRVQVRKLQVLFSCNSTIFVLVWQSKHCHPEGHSLFCKHPLCKGGEIIILRWLSRRNRWYCRCWLRFTHSSGWGAINWGSLPYRIKAAKKKWQQLWILRFIRVFSKIKGDTIVHVDTGGSI